MLTAALLFLLSLPPMYGQDGQLSPRQAFSACKRTGKDCTYLKAKVFESDGNAGSAMDLYLRGGHYDDYIRLQTYSGGDIGPLLEKYRIDDKKALFYRGLSEYTRGKWKEAASILSKGQLEDYLPARSYLAYSYLMMGENDRARRIVQDQPEEMSQDDRLEYRKLEGLILYAENKQMDAKKVFLEVLGSRPKDAMSLKYLAHIYYRTGWFSNAEKIYSSLISSEWRDTELYYLLSDRCEMRTRYLKFDMARKDADRIIREYPDRKDFTVLWISWLLEHDNLSLARRYAESLLQYKTAYEQSLYLMVSGLIEQFLLNDQKALDYFRQANSIYPAPEYEDRIRTAESDLKSMDESRYRPADCSMYRIKKLSSYSWLVESDIFGRNWPVNYTVTRKGDTYGVSIKLKFIHPRQINFEQRSLLWTRYSRSFWSVAGMDLEITKVPLDYKAPHVTINVVPWPSSFYSKRVSSHEWSVLTSPRTVAHEMGHLMGLDDEYYETDKRILERNNDRYIGPRTSIMRNMLSGKPEKRHIHFILSPIKCY